MRANSKEKIKYQGQFLQVSEVSINNYTWEKAYFPDSVVVIPFVDVNTLLFVEERRPHETNESRIKLVTGHKQAHELPTVCANRELMEEAGFGAKTLKEFHTYESSGTLNSRVHFIAAKDMFRHKIPNPDGEDSILNTIYVPIDELEDKLMKQEIPWSLSALALFKVIYLHKRNQLENLFKELHI